MKMRNRHYKLPMKIGEEEDEEEEEQEGEPLPWQRKGETINQQS